MSVNMMDSFTRYWKNVRLDGAVLRILAFLLVTVGASAQDADPNRSQVTQLRLERSADGIVLYSNVRLELSPAVEDALAKGIPMVFLAEADIVRQRWYWTDKKVARAQRHMRLAFQPLTRRWRLHVASGPVSNNSLGLALNLNFDSLQEAMTTLQRISGWKIADAGVIDDDATLKVEFRFSLDMAQLPRPFQIGAFGQSDWNISVTASQHIGPEGTK